MTFADETLDHVEKITIDAGKAIMAIYAEDFVHKLKDDYSPVTDADTIAEKLIISRLNTFTPSIPIVAEESFAAGHAPDISQGRFWLVDPLDGTHEFINKNGEFTVNIALIEGTLPILGVVHAPALNKTYSGVVGLGARIRNNDSGHCEIKIRPAPSSGVTVVASRRHGDRRKIEKFLQGHRVNEVLNTGSSLKFCIVAEGKADIYPRFGRTMEWDTAAGQAILKAAGGNVTKLNGKPFVYAKKGYENPHFIAWGGLKPTHNS